MEPVEGFVTTRHLRLAVRDWNGVESDRPPLVLVHGLASNARIWDLVAPYLQPRFRVVAIDQRGHGQSDKPDEGYDYDTVSDDLVAAVAALGFRRPVIVGHSWGAGVALHLAAVASKLPAAIVLVDGGTREFGSVMTLDEALVRLAPPRLAGTPRTEFIARLRRRWPPEVWSPVLEAAIMGNFAVDDQDHIAPHLTFERHLMVVQALWDARPSRLYNLIRCPVLIVPADPPLPIDAAAASLLERNREAVDFAARTLSDARVVWARDSLHDIPLHHPQFLAEQIAAFVETI